MVVTWIQQQPQSLAALQHGDRTLNRVHATRHSRCTGHDRDGLLVRGSYLVSCPAVLQGEVGHGVQAQTPGGAQQERAQLDNQRREPIATAVSSRQGRRPRRPPSSGRAQQGMDPAHDVQQPE